MTDDVQLPRAASFSVTPPAHIDPARPLVRCAVCRGTDPDDISPIQVGTEDVCDDHADAVRRSVALRVLSRQIDPAHLHAPTTHLHRLLQGWDATQGRGVYLYGDPGTGKSDNASILLRKAFVQLWRSTGHPPNVMWFPVVTGIERIKAGFSTSNGLDPMTLYTPRVLVLDDIGMEQATPWARALLYSIINERMVTNTITIFTSNLTVAALAQRLDSPPIASRIAGTCDQIKMTGKDWRL